MHWYAGFRDPVAEPGREPTLFEWAGGLPALTRMTRLLYEKHVPADPLLAPLFADMPPDQPYRLARWLAEAFGGPASGTSGGDFHAAAFAPANPELTAEQLARWVTLVSRAADEAGLPADPGFRAAFSSCIEWRSRSAAPPQRAVPRWDWGPGGPPAAEAAPVAAGTDEPQGRLPGPDQQVSFAAHIKPLFRARDRQSMSFAFDLSSYADVRMRAADILGRLQDGSMPCDGAWPAARIDVFQRWTETGMRP